MPLTLRNNTVRYLLVEHDDNTPAPVQLGTLLSAYLLALLTDRVLLVDNPAYGETLCEPFTRSSWHLPHAHTVELGAVAAAEGTASLTADQVLARRRPVRRLRLSLDGAAADSDHRRIRCCGNLKEAFAHVQWLTLGDHSGNLLPVLLGNPAHDQQLWQLFPDGFLLAPLFSQLVHPANRLWADMPALLRAFSDSSIERPWRMAVFAGEDDGPETANLRQHGRLVQTALAESPAPPDQSVALLLAPADQHVLTAAMSVFHPPRFLLAASSAHFLSDSAHDVYGRLFTDLLLAQHSDTLLFDQGSSLGWLAHAIRAKPALLAVNRDTVVAIPPMDTPPFDEQACPAASGAMYHL